MSTAAPETIVIVGAGIIGCSTAYFLAHHSKLKPGTRIVVVEGSEVAAGASGKAGGLLALDWHGAATSSLAALSYSLHKSLAEQHSGAERWDYRPLTTLSISADLSTPPPASSSWLSPSLLASASTLGTPSTTAQVHPRKFTQALLDLAKAKAQVTVLFGTVSALYGTWNQGFALHLSRRDSGEMIELAANKIVLAAGPWTGDLVRTLGLKAGRASRIGGERAHSVVVRTLEEKGPLPAQALFTSIKTKKGNGVHEPEIYNRPDGTAYACGPTDSCTLPALASDVTVEPTATREILDQMAALSPEYFTLGQGGARVEVEQACYLPTGSGEPVIGLVKKGVWIASGHSCWGICNGPGTGLCVAELILDGRATSAEIGKLGIS